MPINNPKKLRVNSNERIDIPDFEHAASEYAQELTGAISQVTQLDKRSRIYEGFRIEVTDIANGGLSIYNGSALNVEGEVISDSGTITTTAVTVPAASLSYIEVEYVESATDVDNRAFWDATIANTSPIPPGQEFIRNTSTRTAAGWRVVRPISTSGFTVTTNPESTKVPLAIIQTDGGGAITNHGTLVSMATVLEEAAAVGDTVIKVLNSEFLPPFGAVTQVELASVDSTTIEQQVVNSNDRQGVLDLGAGLAFAYPKGSVVRVDPDPAQKPPSFIAQRVDTQAVQIPFTETGTVAAQPLLPGMNSATQGVDQSPRMFQGDETRGDALSYSHNIPGGRDDLEVQSLKDYVDFLAGQLRELKLGTADLTLANRSMRPGTTDINGNTIANYDATDRYYQYAGGVLGARSVTLTIGDGVTSYGDFNGTDETPFNAALAALPAGGGVIYVKNGTYTPTNSIGLNGTDIENVIFVGESREGVLISSTAAAGAFYITQTAGDSILGWMNMRISSLGGGENYNIRVENDLSPGADNRFYLHNVECGTVFYASDRNNTVDIVDCEIVADTATIYGVTLQAPISGIDAGTTGGVIRNSIIGNTGSTGTGGLSFGSTDASRVGAINISSCSISGADRAILSSGDIEALLVTNCAITGTTGLVSHTNIGADGQNISYKNCRYVIEEAPGISIVRHIHLQFESTTLAYPLVEFTDSSLHCTFTAQQTVSSVFIYIDDALLDSLVIENFVFSFDDPNDALYQTHIAMGPGSNGYSLVKNCYIKNVYCEYGKQALQVYLDSNGSNSLAETMSTNFIVDGLFHLGGISINPQYASAINQQSMFIDAQDITGHITVKGCSFYDVGSANGSSTQTVIDMNLAGYNVGGTFSETTLYATFVDNLIGPVTGDADIVAVSIAGTNTAGITPLEFVNFHNNMIQNVQATTDLALLSCKTLDQLFITDNVMGQIAGGNSSDNDGDALGIVLDEIWSTLAIENNIVQCVATTFAATTSTSTIYIGGGLLTKSIRNNTLATNGSSIAVGSFIGNITAYGGGGWPTSLGLTTISNNQIIGGNIGIMLYGAINGVQVNEVSIADNYIRDMSKARAAIWVSSTQSISNIAISNNSIQGLGGTSFTTLTGIIVETTSTVNSCVISSNIVRATSTQSNSGTEVRGIEVISGAAGADVSVTGNVLVGGTSTSTSTDQAGIWINNMSRVVVSGNVVNWIPNQRNVNSTPVDSIPQIYLGECNTVVVTGNATPGFSEIDAAIINNPIALYSLNGDSHMVSGNAFGQSGTGNDAGMVLDTGTTNVFNTVTNSTEGVGAGSYSIGTLLVS